jgi:DNA ligase 1
MKPMLASDWDESKLRFPLIAQPKIDGVRALNMLGTLTGRSLKQFKNRHVTSLFSHSALIGLDGELAAERDTHPDLCRLTTSATGTIQGQPFLLWWLFDYVTVETKGLAYEQRRTKLEDRYFQIKDEAPHLFPHLRLVPSLVVRTLAELEEHDSDNLYLGYEGTIIRRMDSVHKQGRSTPTEGGLLRIKRFVDFEFTVHEIIEGDANQNEAQINELGQTFRSSHQENKVPNGMIGAMLGRTTSVVMDGDKVLFEAGQEVRVGAGCLPHDQRKYYFENQAEFKKQVHKGKFFPKGIKDKPRFPTWQAFRQAEDIS